MFLIPVLVFLLSFLSLKESSGEALEIPWPEDQPMVPLWPTAARPFGVARSRAFQLAHRGDFPVDVLKVGGRWMVRTADLRRQLALPVYRSAAS